MSTDIATTSKMSSITPLDEGLTPDTIQKYRTAADIANETIKEVIASIKVGGKLVDACELGDNLIISKTAKVYNKGRLEKGIAFPTSIAVNNCLGHYSPMAECTDSFKENDVVKVDLGVHVDGYSVLVAQTHVVVSGETQVNPRAADVISAAYYASEIAQRLLKKGKSNQDITNAIEKVAEAYHCKPVEGVLSHQISRFVLDGEKVIINKTDNDHAVDDFTFEEGEAYCLDIVMSTGEGKGREEDKCTIYKRNTSTSYNLKLKASRAVFGEIIKKFPAMPFTLRALEDKKSKLGIVECVTHDLLQPFPVLYEKEGEFVAQTKSTALIISSGTQIITITNPPNVQSQYKIEDPELLALLAQQTKKSKSKKKAETESKEEPKA